MKFWKRKNKTLAVERRSAEELRASIEEKLAGYNPDKDGSKTTFNTLPLPTCPSKTIRDVRSRIVVEDPEGDRVHDTAYHRLGATDQTGECEDMSDLIAPIPESDFSVDWMEVGDTGIRAVRETTERFWAGDDKWGKGK